MYVTIRDVPIDQFFRTKPVPDHIIYSGLVIGSLKMPRSVLRTYGFGTNGLRVKTGISLKFEGTTLKTQENQFLNYV